MNFMDSTVFIVEGNVVTRQYLEKTLNNNKIETKAFSCAESFLRYEKPINEPSCLVSDFYLEDMSGLELLRLLSDAQSSMATVFFADAVSVETSMTAIRAGAMDFISAPFVQQLLLSAVQRALYQDLISKQKRREVRGACQCFERLTPREQEIFMLVVSGLLNKQIAWELGICEKTVKVHRAQVMKKMCVRSLADLVRLSERLKSVELSHQMEVCC